MKKQLLATMAMVLLWGVATSQVGINTTNPADGSILDIDADDKGILIPRVDIADLSTIAPITGGSPEGLLVYNTNTTIGTGYYYWNGNEWVKVGGSRLVYENTTFADPLPYIFSNNGSDRIGLVNPSLYTLVLSKPTLVEINIRFDVWVATADADNWPVSQTQGFPILYGFVLVNGNLPSGTIICKDVQSHTARPNGNGVNPYGSYTLSGSKYVMLPAGSHTFNLYLMGMGGRSDGNPTSIRGFDITVVPTDSPYFQVILHE